MNIDSIDEQINNNDIDGLIDCFNSLTIENKNNFVNYLIEQLAKYKMPKEHKQRNTVAITLSELNCDAAVPHLVKIIIDEHQSKYIGTLIYSLQNLNCANYINQIFFLMYSGNYEVRRNMFELVSQNRDKISSEDLKVLKKNLTVAIEKYKDILLGLYITKDEIFNE